MDIDEDLEEEEEEEEDGIVINQSQKTNISRAEQKKRAAKWAADNLKGPSGKKEKEKVCGGHSWLTLRHCCTSI